MGPHQLPLRPLGQLLEARRGPHVEVFDYDPAGSLRNILTEATGAAGGGASQPWHLERGNVLTEKDGTLYENDSQKRRTKKTELRPDGTTAITEYRWDTRDRLREVRLPDGRRATYRYDAFARRTEKVLHPATTLREELATALKLTPARAHADSDPGGSPAAAVSTSTATVSTAGASAPAPERTRFLYDGDVLCAERRPTEQGGLRTHVHEPGTFVPLLQYERNTLYTVVNDHLGMPKELVDPRGRVAWAAAHSAWGRIVEEHRDPGTGTDVSSPFRLLGQYADEETGLCYVRFRYFDADAGRWCSPDPLGVEGGVSPCSFDGSPTSEADPYGLAGYLQTGTMDELTDPDLNNNRGDGLDGQELLQHAWLQNNVPGYPSRRGRGLGRDNPAIALPSNKKPDVHQGIGRWQQALGLNDPNELNRLKASEVIDLNADILKQQLVEFGMGRGKANNIVNRMRRTALRYAKNVVPACRR